MYIFIGSVIVGFLLAELIAGRKSMGRNQLIKSLTFNQGINIIHIHHWMWCVGLLIILFIVHYKSSVLNGLLFGAMIQGLTYKDAFKIIYK